MIPDWFKVGITVWFMGFGEGEEVVSIHEDFIDDEDAYWIAKTFDGEARYSLSEFTKYWVPSHTDWASETKNK